MGIQWPNFTQFVNQNVKILGRRLHLPSLKDAAWLENAQLILLILVTFVRNCSSELRLEVQLPRQILLTNVWKMRKTECLLAKLQRPPNLVNAIV